MPMLPGSCLADRRWFGIEIGNVRQVRYERGAVGAYRLSQRSATVGADARLPAGI